MGDSNGPDGEASPGRRPRVVVILSEKSSGSTVLQTLLTSHPSVRHVAHTRHQESETLFWVKAASILGKPQIDMVDSVVPLGRTEARRLLIELATDNIPRYRAPTDDDDLVFESWSRLVRHYAPVFVEKSPHHLLQSSALELMREAMSRDPGVEWLLVGLVRNPIDTLYSQWRRWRTPPEAVERQWVVAYRNLARLAEEAGPAVVVLRYEDVVTNPAVLAPVLSFCGLSATDVNRDLLHGSSIHQWRRDRWFRFRLSPPAAALAKTFGYREDELTSQGSRLWPLIRQVQRWAHLTARHARRTRLRPGWRS